MQSKSVQNWLVVLSFVLAVGAFDYFSQAGTLKRFGVVAVAFFSPLFLYRAYKLFWVKRENLKHHYEMAQLSMSVIKAQRRNKK